MPYGSKEARRRCPYQPKSNPAVARLGYVDSVGRRIVNAHTVGRFGHFEPCRTGVSDAHAIAQCTVDSDAVAVRCSDRQSVCAGLLDLESVDSGRSDRHARTARAAFKRQSQTQAVWGRFERRTGRDLRVAADGYSKIDRLVKSQAPQRPDNNVEHTVCHIDRRVRLGVYFGWTFVELRDDGERRVARSFNVALEAERVGNLGVGGRRESEICNGDKEGWTHVWQCFGGLLLFSVSLGGT